MIKLAAVSQVYPMTRKVDLTFLDSRLSCAGVSCMVGSVGSDYGIWDIPAAVKPTDESGVGGFNVSARNIIAVCAFFGARESRPIVLGFLRPADSVLSFTQDNRQVHLHPSGTYTTVAPDGSFEVYKPGGGYLRIGTGPHENLAAVAANGWNEPTASPPTITASNGQGTIVIDPEGNITVTAAGNFAADVQGNMTAIVQGNMSSTVTGTVAIYGEGEVAISSAAALTLTAPSVIGGEAGATPLRLATETFVLDVYNAHTHPVDGDITGVPNQPGASGDMTAQFKAS
jgi:hypothetical protein